jgi:hypothetical protein
VLRSRLEAGRQLYNAVLGEAMSRLGKMRKDIDFAVAKAMREPFCQESGVHGSSREARVSGV